MMAVRDVLLQMSSYPAVTSHWAIDAAAWFAEKFGARIPAGLCQVHVPDISNWARTRDLALVPVDADLDWRCIAEALIFESGRPVLLLRRTGCADLVVIGACGHPRALEIVLGGATRSVLDRVPLPPLLSH